VRQTTKFPQSPALQLMLTESHLNGDPDALRFITVTLDAMAYGGIYDQLGGGFHRYSTERTWSIPHFEKMLYDNAQLLGIYARAWQLTGKPQYRRIARGVRDYLRARMMSPHGGFYTAEDAAVGSLSRTGSGVEEGASYLWSRSQIEALLGTSAERFFGTYALTPMPDQVDSLQPEAARGVLRVQRPVAGDATRVEQELASLEPQRRKLLSARNARSQPARDEKLLVGWNGLAIDAFVISGTVFHSRDDIAIARRAAERIWALTWNAQSGQLSHEIFRGRAQGSGFLEDYALLGRGFLSLHEATGDELWLRRARLLADALLRQFDAGGSGVLAVSTTDTLIAVPVDEGDGAYPSGTSSAVELLARLGRADGDRRYADAATRIAHQASGHPELWPALVAAVGAHDLGAGTNSRPSESASALDRQLPDGTARHVHASATSGSSGNHREIVITLDIEQGYHINANPASFDFLIPTSVSFTGVRPVEVRYPAPKLFKPGFVPEVLKVYEGTVQVVATLEDGALSRVRTVNATIDAQACTETVCLPPARLPLTISIAP
jgi:uncharacterized protein